MRFTHSILCFVVFAQFPSGHVYPASNVVGSQGVGTIKLDKNETWHETRLSVVFAQVVSVEELDAARQLFQIRARPLVTLAGGLASWGRPELAARFNTGGFGFPIKSAPARGDFAILVVVEKEDGFVIPGAWCPAITGSSPLTVVNGLHDPRVHDLIMRLRDVDATPRGNERPSDYERVRAGGLELSERLRIAATSSEPRALWLLATDMQPLAVQLLVASNPHTRRDIVEAYATHEHPLLRAAAEWNLRQREAAATQPSSTKPSTTQPAQPQEEEPG